MEIEVSGSNSVVPSMDLDREKKAEEDRIRLKRKTLEHVLDQCHRALELLSSGNGVDDDDDSDGGPQSQGEASREDSSVQTGDREADELCDLLKSRVECPDFLEKLEHAQSSVPPNVTEEGSSWDMINENDLWDGENPDSDQEDYVLVRQEDIVEGIACFMAAYLLSLKQTKDLTPNQLQEGNLILSFVT
ncbi:hypothetical protein HS088_TW06G00949 [Tripterygium wilfordii]|uniref:Uncharacterized protein n=1 Tax=Tripterygium wilfordii TaxID=458696 RepID=A0A7J7DKK4_TRIWF|nr:hypothetical protein HS088_TW06G00949 [Tripterygium wilfordii]